MCDFARRARPAGSRGPNSVFTLVPGHVCWIESGRVGKISGFVSCTQEADYTQPVSTTSQWDIDHTEQSIRSLKQSLIEEMCQKVRNGHSAFLPSEVPLRWQSGGYSAWVAFQLRCSHTGAQMPSCQSCPQELGNGVLTLSRRTIINARVRDPSAPLDAAGLLWPLLCWLPKDDMHSRNLGRW